MPVEFSQNPLFSFPFEIPPKQTRIWGTVLASPNFLQLMENVKTKHVPKKAGPSLEAASNYNYLTASAIGKIIGVTPQTVNNWRRSGLIPASIEVEDTVRYNLDHVRKALDALTKEKEIARKTAPPEIAPRELPDHNFGSEGLQSTRAMARSIDGPILAALVASLPIYLKAIADELHKIDSPSSEFWRAGMLGADSELQPLAPNAPVRV